MEQKTIHQLELSQSNTLLMIVDIQEKLCKPLDQKWLSSTIDQIGLLTLYAKNENIPVMLTEQYPQGLGPTRKEVNIHLEGIEYELFAKNCFNGSNDDNILNHLNMHKDKNIIITGMETHICVYLTALGLIKHGFNVFVPHDCVIARDKGNHENGIKLAEVAGANIINAETLVFQMLQKSEGKTFKEISQYLKNQ